MPRANNAQPPRTAFIRTVLVGLMPMANSSGEAHLARFAGPKTGICFVPQQTAHLRTIHIRHKTTHCLQGSPRQNSRPKKLIN